MLDLSEIAGLSSLMLGRLVMLQKKLESRGAKFILRNVPGEILDTLAATKLDEVLKVEEAS